MLLQPLGPGLYLGLFAPRHDVLSFVTIWGQLSFVTIRSLLPCGIDSEFALPKALTAAGVHAIIRRQPNEGRGSPADEKGRHGTCLLIVIIG
jgi:hypothetical protein